MVTGVPFGFQNGFGGHGGTRTVFFHVCRILRIFPMKRSKYCWMVLVPFWKNLMQTHAWSVILIGMQNLVQPCMPKMAVCFLNWGSIIQRCMKAWLSIEKMSLSPKSYIVPRRTWLSALMRGRVRSSLSGMM